MNTTGQSAHGGSSRPSRPSSRPSHSARRSSTTGRAAIVAEPADAVNTPDVSDDESADLSQGELGSLPESAKSLSQAIRKPESEDALEAREAAADVPSIPLQKRRRVTRACDVCRGKKIKCDGKQPCTHCSVYSYGNATIPPSAPSC